MQPVAGQLAHLQVGVTDAQHWWVPARADQVERGQPHEEQGLGALDRGAHRCQQSAAPTTAAVAVVDSHLDPAAVNVSEEGGGMDAVVGDLEERVRDVRLDPGAGARSDLVVGGVESQASLGVVVEHVAVTVAQEREYARPMSGVVELLQLEAVVDRMVRDLEVQHRGGRVGAKERGQDAMGLSIGARPRAGSSDVAKPRGVRRRRRIHIAVLPTSEADPIPCQPIAAGIRLTVSSAGGTCGSWSTVRSSRCRVLPGASSSR